MTPVEAVKTDGGIQKVQELLEDMAERNDNIPPALRVDVARICKKLGIPIPNGQK